MTIKLRCVEDCVLNGVTHYDDTIFHKGDVANASICDYEYGIRIQKPDGRYSFPYCIENIEKYFVAEGTK